MSDEWNAVAADGAEVNGGHFEQTDDTSANPDDGFAGEVAQEETGRIQEDKINKKKLAELENDGRMLQIFLRPNKKSGHIPYTGVKNIPLNAATICCNDLFEKIVKKGHKYYIIEDSNVAPYNFIFDWIKQCAEEQNVANMPEIKDMVTTETGLQPFIDIMLAAQKLKIPTASFNKFMIKKLTPIARDHLIDLETVSRIFDSGDADMYGLDLHEVAAVSIFNHWYNYLLDAPEYYDYMCKLHDMRENIPELDDALHKAVSDKDDFLKKRRQDRAEQQANEQSGGGWGANNGESADFGAGDNTFATADGGDNAWINQTSSEATGEWQTNTSATTADWDMKESTSASGPGWAADTGAAGGNWADEVNDTIKPAPVVAAGGGW